MTGSGARFAALRPLPVKSTPSSANTSDLARSSTRCGQSTIPPEARKHEVPMTTRIGIVADPGLPERRAKALFADLQAAAKDHRTGEPAELYLRIGSFPMSSRGTVELHDNTIEVLEKYQWDRLIYLTDLPLSTRRPVISQCIQNGKATMLCLPAFGLLRAKLGLKQEMTRLVQGKMAGAGVPEENIDGYEDIAGGDVRADTTRVLEGRGRTLRLLLGMIRCN